MRGGLDGPTGEEGMVMCEGGAGRRGEEGMVMCEGGAGRANGW